MKLNKAIVATVVVCALSTAPQADACELLSSFFGPSQAQIDAQNLAYRKKQENNISAAIRDNDETKLFAAVDSLGRSGEKTAWYWAIGMGNADAVRALIGRYNVNVGAGLYLATKRGKHASMQALLNAGATPRACLLEKAVENNDDTALEILFGDPRMNLDEQDNDGNTLLSRAIARRDETFAQLLIGLGADTTIANNDGRVVQEFIDARNDEECCVCYETQEALDQNGRDNQLRKLPRCNGYICEKDLAIWKRDGGTNPLTRQPFPANYEVGNACAEASHTLTVMI